MKRPSNADGMILVIVLWAIAIMTVIVVALSALSQKSFLMAGVETDRLRSRLALESGVEAAVGTILAVQPEARVFLGGAPVTADIGGGRIVEIRVMDAAGLVDLNRADPKLIAALLDRVGAARGSAAAILDALKKLRPQPDQGKAQPRQDEPPVEAPPTVPLPPVWFSTAQLRSIDGVSPSDVAKILPHITLYSSDGKVNPLAASDMVLGAVPDLSPPDRQVLRTAIRRKQWQIPAVEAVLARQAKYLAVAEPRVFLVGVEIVEGPGVIRGSRLTTTVLLDSTAKKPFRVLSWSW